MKFRAVRPADAAQADVTIVPLFDDRQAPKSLARGKRAIVERLAGERGAASLYNVFTHVGGDKEGRVVVVGAGKRAEYDAERARNIASAGIKSLWKTDAKTAAIYVDGTIGEARAVQAAVEGAHFAMWRPEAHRSKPEERRLPPLSTVSIVAEGNVRDAIRRGDAVGQAVNLARRMANEPANKMTPTIVGVILFAGSFAIRRAVFTAWPTASPRRSASRTFPSTTIVTVARGGSRRSSGLLRWASGRHIAKVAPSTAACAARGSPIPVASM